MYSDDSVHYDQYDMESQMFKYSDNLNSVNYQNDHQATETTDDQESSFFVDLVLKRTRHLKYNISMAFLSGLKVIATIAILVECPTTFPYCVNYWLYTMIAYDVINVVSRFMLIKLLIPKKRKQVSKKGAASETLIPSEEPEDEEEIRQRRKITFATEIGNPFQLQEGKEERAVQAVALTRFLYILLLGWGNVICYVYLRPVDQPLNLRTTLFYVYICFGYIYLGIPTLIFLLDCIVAWARDRKKWFIKARNGGSESDGEGDIMIYRKYTVNLSGKHICGICNNEYGSNDNLIQLQCNAAHHFHEKCLSKVVEREAECPLCHRKIAGRKGSYNSADTAHRSSAESIFL